jgi:hypothetical protein
LIAAGIIKGSEWAGGQASKAINQRRGQPAFAATNPQTGQRSVVDAVDLAHLNPAQLRAWAVHHYLHGTPPADTTSTVPASMIPAHSYIDADGQQRDSVTGHRTWNPDTGSEPRPLEVIPPPHVYVDPNGHWRNRTDGSLYTGITVPRNRERPVYDCDNPEPPRIRMSEHDYWYGEHGAHTETRHSPRIPLERGDGPTGERTIEGRIYGDDPWPRSENWSYQWLDDTVKQDAIQTYVNENWEEICVDVAELGQHEGLFDYGNEVGLGYYNSAMYTSEPRHAGFGRTSMVKIRFRSVPDSETEFFIETAFPAGRGN